MGTNGASSSPLCLRQLTLPEFTGRENLDWFTEQLTNVLISAGVSAKFWVTYLKQQCRKDAHAFDVICNYESTHASEIYEKTSNAEYLDFYRKCLTCLTTQHGVHKEQQICQLLSTYHSMSQQQMEFFVDFAHRFLDTLHSLEKLIPGIHRSGRDIELIHAFMLKLQPTISKDLISRDSTFSSLTAVIEAAKRFESVDSQKLQVAEKFWTPHATFAAQPASLSLSTCSAAKAQELKVDSTFSKPKDHLSGTPVCRFYNKFDVANCEMPNHQCSHGYIHKCSTCFKVSCKVYNLHKPSNSPFLSSGSRHPP